MSKLKILCLHGKEQNAEMFRTRLGRIPVKAKHDFHIIDAPYLLPLKPGNDVQMRSWYHRDLDGSWNISSIESTLEYIAEIWKCNGPFHGIIGFSQGGTFAAIIAATAERFEGLRFVICLGAPDVQHSNYTCISPSISSLHFAGKGDQVVPLLSSRTLSSRFNAAVYIEHEQGHCIPMKAEYISRIVDFINANAHYTHADSEISRNAATASSATGQSLLRQLPQLPKQQSTSTPTSSPPVCSTESNAAQQRDEIEVLDSIYGTDIAIVRPAPIAMGNPTGSLLINICSQQFMSNFERSSTMKIDGGPIRWAGQLKLKFEMSAGYPDDDSPVVELETGTLSMIDFSIAMRRSLLNTVVSSWSYF